MLASSDMDDERFFAAAPTCPERRRTRRRKTPWRAALPSALAVLVIVGGCAAPQSLRPQQVLKRIAADYRQFFPGDGDPDLQHDAGLLRPRFGLPALLSEGERFTVELLERGGPAPVRLGLLRSGLDLLQARTCLAKAAASGTSSEPPEPSAPASGDCFPLRIVSQQRSGVSVATSKDPMVEKVELTVQAPAAVPPGGYDLYVESVVDAPVRAPRSVWLRSRAASAAESGSLRVAHLTDLHLGKGETELLANLERTLAEVNAGAPDLVVVTGDLANLGTRGELVEKAKALLLRVQAPVIVIIGNHDLGFGPTPVLTAGYGAGWVNFSRAFHPQLLFTVALGRWEFVGFDSGPSVVSPRVLTRGLSDDTLAALSETLADARIRGYRGVVLFSHAPSRAALTTRGDPAHVGLFGRMRRGATAFEHVLIDAAPGLRLIHLAGHTHWSDLFEASAQSGQRPRRFHRWPADTLGPCPQPLHGQVSLITTQSASHTTFPYRRNGKGYGFTWLLLGESMEQVAFMRFHGAVPERCPTTPPPAASS